MSLKIRPVKAPYLAGKKDYTDMMKAETRIEALQRKTYRFSQFNKPYGHNMDYPSMEYIYPDPIDVAGNYNLNLGGLKYQKDIQTGGVGGAIAECGGCVVSFTENLIRCNCQDESFPGEVMLCITGEPTTELTYIKPYVNSVKLLSRWPLGNGCVNRCYMLELGDCRQVSNQLCIEGQFGRQVKVVIGYACGQPIYGLYVRDSECHQCNGSITISGSDTITTSSTSQYSATACYQNGLCESSAGVSWSVSGTGASISDTGLLTTSASACGMLTVSANCPQCGISDTHEVRVTDAGKWNLVALCDIAPPKPLGESYCACEVQRIAGRYKYCTGIYYTNIYLPGTGCTPYDICTCVYIPSGYGACGTPLGNTAPNPDYIYMWVYRAEKKEWSCV